MWTWEQLEAMHPGETTDDLHHRWKLQTDETYATRCASMIPPVILRSFLAKKADDPARHRRNKKRAEKKKRDEERRTGRKAQAATEAPVDMLRLTRQVARLERDAAAQEAERVAESIALSAEDSRTCHFMQVSESQFEAVAVVSEIMGNVFPMSRGGAADGADSAGLDEVELQVCGKMGVRPADFAAAAEVEAAIPGDFAVPREGDDWRATSGEPDAVSVGDGVYTFRCAR